jgi:SAM-dependent methyltransferase
LTMDDIARRNREFWRKMVRDAGRDANRYTRPWLNLKPDLIRAFSRGDVETLPEPYAYIYPRSVFSGLEGKKVLCLASGGGQQSAVFGILSAEVTVLDLTEEQLEADRKASQHFGYSVTTVEGDMRDLSGLEANTYDLVYQAISMCFVPDVREVYTEVARVVKPGGMYRVGHCNPATQIVDETSWDGEGYSIACIYGAGRIDDPDTFEFRHLLQDIFNGLVECGFVIRGVWEDPRHLCRQRTGEPGTYDHMLGFVQQHFAVVAERAKAK